MIQEKEVTKTFNEIARWIESWTNKNNYTGLNLIEFNAKFKVDFNTFLSTSSFLQETIKLFLIK